MKVTETSYASNCNEHAYCIHTHTLIESTYVFTGKEISLPTIKLQMICFNVCYTNANTTKTFRLMTEHNTKYKINSIQMNLKNLYHYLEHSTVMKYKLSSD